MPSQSDLDQGGTPRQWTKSYMGPSVGWINVPLQNVLYITVAGTYNLDPSISLVEVNCAGAVVIVLPRAGGPGGSLSQQGLFAKNPITISDVGGQANAHPITIQPNPIGGETIIGLASVTLNSNYGGIILQPNPITNVWNAA
jgi:hypothetical protein